MTTSDLRGLADQLGLWTGTNWMLTAFPAWMLLLVPAILSIGLFVVLRTCVEFRSPKLHKQYPGFWPGNVFASFGLGLLIVGMAFYASPVVDPFWRSLAWGATTLIVSLGGTLFLFIYEFKNALDNRKSAWADDKSYTLYQLFTPTAIAFRFSMFALIYLFMKVGVVALSTGAVPWPLKLAAIVLLAMWAYCVMLDNTRPRPNLADVYPTSGAWFGLGGKNKRRNASAPASPAAPAPRPARTETWQRSPGNGDNLTGVYRYGDGDTDGYGFTPFRDTDSFGDESRSGGYRSDQAPGYQTDQAPTGYRQEPMPPRATPPGERTTALPPFRRNDGGQQPGQDRTHLRAAPAFREEGEGDNSGGATLPKFRRPTR